MKMYNIPLTAHLTQHAKTIAQALPAHIDKMYGGGVMTQANNTDAATHTPPKTVTLPRAFRASFANLFS